MDCLSDDPRRRTLAAIADLSNRRPVVRHFHPQRPALLSLAVDLGPILPPHHLLH